MNNYNYHHGEHDDDHTSLSSSTSAADAYYASGGIALGVDDYNYYSSSSDSDDDDEDCFLKTESSVEAAALVTYQQMVQGKPILLGRNQDKTCNVQLPSGKVIVVESSAFPEFKDKSDKDDEDEEEERPPSVLQDPQWRRYVQQPGSSTSNSSSNSQNKNNNAGNANSNKPNQPIRTKSRAAVEEIEAAIPSAASCVFHIFDRRVNLDQYDGASSTNYELLRAWVQDDPYRVRPKRAEPPSCRRRKCFSCSTTRTPDGMKSQMNSPAAPATATVVNKTAAAAAPSPSDKKPDAVETDTGNNKTATNRNEKVDIIAELKRYKTKLPFSMASIRDEWIDHAQSVKRQKTTEFLARDKQAAESLKQRLGLKLL